jgi:hypothetical protein
MHDLLIRIKRATDGSSALTCVRANGTVTWQRQEGARGRFFPGHDLTHYVVETTLGYRRGFYGLIVEGWDMSDFAAPWPRGPLPAEAVEVELVVGLFDLERSMGPEWTPAELRAEGARYAESTRDAEQGIVLPHLSDDDIARVRAARAEVFARWAAIEPGEALELPFTRARHTLL